MITLHRLGHTTAEPFHLNPDLIVTVEATPDTVITLTTGAKVVVAESPERVVRVRDLPRRDALRGPALRRASARAGARPPRGVPPAVAARGGRRLDNRLSAIRRTHPDSTEVSASAADQRGR